MNLIFKLQNNLLKVILLAFLFGCQPQSKKEESIKSPNVLFIAVDDLNNWLGCMNGHPNTKTPNLDKLASGGVLFTHAYCQAPLCGPSRASLMSGLRPSTTGIYGMIDDNKIRSENPATKDIVFLPEYFRNQGYHTMGIGKLFHEHAPEGAFDESGGRIRGFGPLPKERLVWDGKGTAGEGYGKTSTDWGAFPETDTLMPDHHSADWVIERLNRQYDKPFFLGVGFVRPHVPWYVPQKWFDMHPVEQLAMTPYKEDDLDDIPEVGLKINDLPMMPSTKWAIENNQWANIIQAYLACVSFVDYEVGRVLQALEKSEYAENTVIVLWSDHGYRLGEKGTFTKHALWEEATNPPLMFAGAGIPKGKVVDQPAEMLSVYPTLLELCGLPKYERNEGISLVSLIKNSSNDENDLNAITTYGMNNHAVRTEQFRYIRYEDGGEELYDHFSDPSEWYNLAKVDSLTATKSQLKRLLPNINEKWDENSAYNYQPYFVEQKQRTNN
jgi:arylsulfatase A-like enzyme